MVEVIVPSRFDQLVNNDGTPTTLFSAYLESLTDNNNDNIDIVEPYYRSLAALAALRAEVEDLKIIHSVNLIPADDTLEKRIDDLQEEMISFVLGLIKQNQVDLFGFLKNVVEDVTPQLGGNLDTQSFTVDGRDIGADGALLDTALQNIVEDTTPQLGGELDGQDVKIINILAPTSDNDVAIKVYVDDADALLFPLSGGTVTGIYDGNNTTDSTSTTTGSIHTDGGIGVVKNATIGSVVEAAGLTISDVPGGTDNQVLSIDRPDTSTTRIRTFRTSGAVDFQDLRLEAQTNLFLFTAGAERVKIASNGNTLFQSKVSVNGTTSTINSGSGTPEGSVTATIGSTFMRTDGGANTSFYVKESGTGNTGWVAK